MNDPGEIVGMVDVLKLTYATLEQVGSLASKLQKALHADMDRLTRCRPVKEKVQLGANSGYHSTTSPIPWYPARQVIEVHIRLGIAH